MSNKNVELVELNSIEISTSKGEKVKPLEFLPNGMKLHRFTEPFENTPAYKLGFVYDEPYWRELVTAFIAREQIDLARPGILSVGLPGTGKSYSLRQLAAILNRPLFEATGRNDMEIGELNGRMIVQASPNGGTDTTHLSGPLVNALRQEYSIFLMEEVDRIPPEVSVNLNTLLDGYGHSVPDLSKVFDVPTGFVFYGTANGNGQGDQSGLCTTSQLMDFSTVERYSAILEAKRLSDEDQLTLLRDVATIKGKQKIPDVALNAFIKFGNLALDSFQSGNHNALPAPVSIRTLTDLVITSILFVNGNDSTSGNRWKFWLDKAYISKIASKHAPDQKGVIDAVYELGKLAEFDTIFQESDDGQS